MFEMNMIAVRRAYNQRINGQVSNLEAVFKCGCIARTDMFGSYQSLCCPGHHPTFGEAGMALPVHLDQPIG